MSLPAGPILIAILHLPPCWADRHDARQFDHLTRIAYAIAEEARDTDEAAAGVTISKFEGGNCIAVQDHYTHSGGWSTFQLEGWKGKYQGPFVGLDYIAIHNAAAAALDIWRHSHQCGQSPNAMFTAYAGRPYCGIFIDENGNTITTWPTLNSRVSLYWFVRSIIDREMKRYE